jgi:hypothetical protein
VTSKEKVGELARFYTDSNYPVPIFRYDRREVQAVLPKEANAYELVGDPTRTGGADSQETCLVQGYRIEVDHTKRLIRQSVLANDFEMMMALLEKKAVHLTRVDTDQTAACGTQDESPTCALSGTFSTLTDQERCPECNRIFKGLVEKSWKDVAPAFPG